MGAHDKPLEPLGSFTGAGDPQGPWGALAAFRPSTTIPNGGKYSDFGRTTLRRVSVDVRSSRNEGGLFGGERT